MAVTYDPALVELHDADLPKTDAGRTIDEARGAAATHIRATVARMLGTKTAMTFEGWATVPCRTELDTIGVVDIACGTAYDSGVAILPEADALGYVDTPIASANNTSADATVIAYGRDGSAEEIGRASRELQYPAGWRQILLPTWRGYQGAGDKLVPDDVIAKHIHPARTIVGLTTVYGTRKWPQRIGDPICGASRAWRYPDQKAADHAILAAIDDVCVALGPAPTIEQRYPRGTSYPSAGDFHDLLPHLDLGLSPYLDALSEGASEGAGIVAVSEVGVGSAAHRIATRVRWLALQRIWTALDAFAPLPEYTDLQPGHAAYMAARRARADAANALGEIALREIIPAVRQRLAKLDAELLDLLVGGGPTEQPWGRVYHS